MSSNNLNGFVNAAKQKGFTVDFKFESTNGYLIEVRKGDGRVVQCIVDMQSYVNGGDTLMIDSISRCMNMLEAEAQGKPTTAAERDVLRISQLERELEKYKAAVKQLSFDLEMKSTTPRAVATEADVRKQTLEMAADFLMDYGIIKTGTELESVCEQIRKLHPTKAATMGAAAAKMGFTWKGNPYDSR